MKNKYFLFSILFFSLIFFDQALKYIVRFYRGFYFCNSSIAWGIKIPLCLFWTFWILIVFFLFYLLYRELFKNPHPQIMFVSALVLISGGTAGNFIDRIIFGCVIDFIDLKIWPTFNLADSFIVIGAIILLVSQLKTRSSQ